MTVVTAALQRLLLVTAAVALLGHGGLEIAPRLAAAAASSTASAAAPTGARTTTRPAAESQPVPPASTLRTALAVPAPTGGADIAAGPGAALSVAPHLLARPVVRPPTRSSGPAPGGGASGRAPPAPAGT